MNNDLVRTASIVVGFLVVSQCGCGRTSDVELHEVYGNITMDGEPLADARVVYTLAKGGRSAYGVTDEKGSYQLEWSSTATGATPGEYIVSVSTYREADAHARTQTGEPVSAHPETVPSVYNQDTTLAAEVPKGEYDFDLKSDASEVVQPGRGSVR